LSNDSSCYTNHALDQFLEHLIETGIQKVIRIGGQSSSTLLEGKNLRLVAQTERRTGPERQILGATHGELESHEKTVRSQLGAIKDLRKAEWACLDGHLRLRHPEIHRQFSRTDDEGFTRVTKLKPFDLWISGKGENLRKYDRPAWDIEEILNIANRNIYTVALSDRRRLVDHWTLDIQQSITHKISDAMNTDATLRRQLTNVYDEVDRRVLETAEVIGVTTTGLAKRISVLRHVDAKVVVCEEAGEVLEAHMLSALIPSVQHLIQIGDHLQLRPQINNFSLSLESRQGRPYQLDRSQFERLAVSDSGRVPVSQLNVQRRMRPEISALIRNTLYARLMDHSNVETLPDVTGMRRNVYWCDHSNLEDSQGQDMKQRSKSNAWEVNMTHCLVRHLVRQGTYSSQDIAVLTPYTGQLQKLRAVLRQDFEIVLSERDQTQLAKDGLVDESKHPATEAGQTSLLQRKPMNELLRIATVDNFQGEEAKVVIVSLVRSNKEKKVGFLRTTNRINVLLSRAQHGMFLIGNAETYSNVSMWSQVLGMLRFNDCVGEAFGLRCPRHPQTEIFVSDPNDFAIVSPEGGCREACTS